MERIPSAMLQGSKTCSRGCPWVSTKPTVSLRKQTTFYEAMFKLLTGVAEQHREGKDWNWARRCAVAGGARTIPSLPP